MDTALEKSVKSPLALTLASSGARLDLYAGVETAANFGDGNTEFAAITRACGIYDLGWRTKIEIKGEDRVRWLNGMVTNNIKDLPLNHGNYNFVLSAQGRIQGDLYAYNRGDQIILDTERSQVESLLKILNHYIIMDDVELSDASDKLTAIGVQGPDATATLKRIGIEPNCAAPLVLCDLTWNGVSTSITRMMSDQFLTYEVWLPPQQAGQLWDALIAANAKPAGTDALEKFRVLAGVPRYGVDIRQRELPQETGQTQAINFTKGCYIGQEIVERIRSQGNLHRNFTGFVLDRAVEPGTKIMLNDKQVGELTSVAHVPDEVQGEKILGLGYIRREVGGPGTKIIIGDTTATLAVLPFKQ